MPHSNGRVLAGFLALALAAPGCGNDGGGSGDDATTDVIPDVNTDGTDTVMDTLPDEGPDTVPEDTAGDPGEEDAAPSTITLSFDMQVDGAGSSRIGALTFADAGGTSVVLGEEIPALAYEITDWTDYGYTLFHVLAPEDGELNVMYLYCTASGLEWVWHEDWSLAMDVETGSGDCTWSMASTTVDVPALASITARPAVSQLIDGFTLDGTDVHYSTGPGILSWAGEDFDLYPFEVVDCSTECTADPADGWWELHSMLEGPESGTCFGILYLMKSTTDQVQLGYPVCLDPVSVRDAAWLTTTWSSPTGGGGGVPDGPRPMGAAHMLRPLPPLGLHPAVM